MKQYILIVFALAAFSSMQAQEIPQREVPSVIVNNFSTQYPNASDVEWEMKNGHYLVDFELELDKDYKVWYDATGEIVKTKEEISKQALPAAISSAIESHFKGYKIDDVEKITTNGNVSYEVELDTRGKEEWKVTFDEKGKILSKIAD